MDLVAETAPQWAPSSPVSPSLHVAALHRDGKWLLPPLLPLGLLSAIACHKTVWLKGKIKRSGKEPFKKRSRQKIHFSFSLFYYIENYKNVLKWTFLLFGY